MTEPVWRAEWEHESPEEWARKYYDSIATDRKTDRNTESTLKRYTYVIREYLVTVRESGFRGAVERTHARIDYTGIGIETVRNIAGHWRSAHGVRVQTPTGAPRQPSAAVAALTERIAALESRLAGIVAIDGTGLRPRVDDQDRRLEELGVRLADAAAAGREERDKLAVSHYALVRVALRLAVRANASDLVAELTAWLDEREGVRDGAQ